MVTMEQFHRELREKLGEDASPRENRCPHYRYYRPSDLECPYETHPQRLFWMCERDFHHVYGCHDGCRSYLDLWAEWEANRDWVGPEQYVDGLLLSNQFEVLDGPGTVSHDRAVEVSDERYEQFADRRRKEEARLADESDLLIEGLKEGIKDWLVKLVNRHP